MTPRTVNALRVAAVLLLGALAAAVLLSEPPKRKPPAIRAMERRIANLVRLHELASYPLPGGGALRVLAVPEAGTCVVIERREEIGRWTEGPAGDGKGLGLGLGISCDFKVRAAEGGP